MQVLDPSEFEVVGPGRAPAPVPMGHQTLDPNEYEVVQPKKVGKVESFLRGAKQGLTLGFGDEISGALESAFSDKTYQQARDEARANDAAAKEANPWTFGAGEIGGGAATMFVPGLGLAKGATAARAALSAAKVGAAAGLGNSEADLTQGEFGRAALDTAVGAGLGAAAGAVGHKVGRIFSGAQERVDQRLMGEIGDKANKGIRDKLAGTAGERAPKVVEVTRDLNLDKTAKDAPKLFEKATAAKKEIGQKLGTIYQTVDQEVGAPSMDTAVGALAELEKKYTAKGMIQHAKAVQKVADNMIVGLGDAPSTEAFHGFSSALGDQAFESLSETASKRVQKDISRTITGVLKDHIKEATKASDVVAKVAKNYGELNQQYGIVSDIATAAAQRAKKLPYPTTGLRDISRETGSLWSDVKRGARGAMSAATAPADRVLAKLVTAAQEGNPKAVATLTRAYGSVEQAAAQIAPSAPGYGARGLRGVMGLGPIEEDEDQDAPASQAVAGR